MKTIKITVAAETPFASHGDDDRESTELDVEVEDNATKEEIEKACDEAAKEWFYDLYNY